MICKLYIAGADPGGYSSINCIRGWLYEGWIIVIHQIYSLPLFGFYISTDKDLSDGYNNATVHIAQTFNTTALASPPVHINGRLISTHTI